jgi:hypothetical protein
VDDRLREPLRLRGEVFKVAKGFVFKIARIDLGLGVKPMADAVRFLSQLQPEAFDGTTLELAAAAPSLRALHSYATGASPNAIIADLSLAARYQPTNSRMRPSSRNQGIRMRQDRIQSLIAVY